MNALRTKLLAPAELLNMYRGSANELAPANPIAHVIRVTLDDTRYYLTYEKPTMIAALHTKYACLFSAEIDAHERLARILEFADVRVQSGESEEALYTLQKFARLFHMADVVPVLSFKYN